jgi:hypothetical protein
MAISFGFNGGLWLSCSCADVLAMAARNSIRPQTAMLVERAGRGEPELA